MAFLQFPMNQYFLIVNDDIEVNGGFFQISEGIELQHVMATLILKGQIAGTEELRLNIYSSITSDVPTYSSNWISLSDIGAYSGNWFGNVYFDFEGNSLNPNIRYAMKIEPRNYTRDGDDFYIGMNLDWSSEVNEIESVTGRGMRIRILGLK